MLEQTGCACRDIRTTYALNKATAKQDPWAHAPEDAAGDFRYASHLLEGDCIVS